METDTVAESQKVAELPSLDFLIEKAKVHLSYARFRKAGDLYDKMLVFYPEDSRAHWGKLLVEKECASNEELVNQNVEIRNSTNYQNAIRYAECTQRRIYESIEQKSTKHVVCR